MTLKLNFKRIAHSSAILPHLLTLWLGTIFSFGCTTDVDAPSRVVVNRVCGGAGGCSSSSQGGKNSGGFTGNSTGAGPSTPAGYGGADTSAGTGGTISQEMAGAAGTAGYEIGAIAGISSQGGEGGEGGTATGGNDGAGGQDGDAGASGQDGDAGASGGAPCPIDMVSIQNFCIDTYEAPNQKGAMPLAMQTAQDGEIWCEARGKRLCTEAEWVQSCEGSKKTKYPYGNTYEAHRCNDDKTWISPDWNALATWPSQPAQTEATHLYQADPSGSRADCASEEGVMDLTGNVAEWVVRSFPTQKNYDHVLKGCYWSKCYGGSNPSCSFVNGAHPGNFRTYEAGFRCCLDASP